MEFPGSASRCRAAAVALSSSISPRQKVRILGRGRCRSLSPPCYSCPHCAPLVSGLCTRFNGQSPLLQPWPSDAVNQRVLAVEKQRLARRAWASPSAPSTPTSPARRRPKRADYHNTVVARRSSARLPLLHLSSGSASVSTLQGLIYDAAPSV